MEKSFMHAMDLANSMIWICLESMDFSDKDAFKTEEKYSFPLFLLYFIDKDAADRLSCSNSTLDIIYWQIPKLGLKDVCVVMYPSFKVRAISDPLEHPVNSGEQASIVQWSVALSYVRDVTCDPGYNVYFYDVGFIVFKVVFSMFFFKMFPFCNVFLVL